MEKRMTKMRARVEGLESILASEPDGRQRVMELSGRQGANTNITPMIPSDSCAFSWDEEANFIPRKHHDLCMFLFPIVTLY